jgi:two-component system NtrC family sensor kinase
MLRTRLFQSFAALLILYGVLSAWFAIRVIQTRLVNEAQDRVQFDLRSAWDVYEGQLKEIETVVKLLSAKSIVVDVCAGGDGDNSDLRARLENFRHAFGLDFLTVVSAAGEAMVRAAPPHHRGDRVSEWPLVEGALGQGAVVAGAQVFSAAELRRENEELADRAVLPIEATPHARPSDLAVEERGLVLVAAAPVREGDRVLGVVYAGLLLNRNFDLIDRIQASNYGADNEAGAVAGAATIFLHDTRIATTVRLPSGSRALGSRLSREVAERVLDHGRPWIGRAFVVDDWYLSAYEPIRDLAGNVAGILYVGLLERPFRQLGWTIIWRYIGLTLLAVLAALGVAYFVAARLAAPIHRLAQASEILRTGAYPVPVESGAASSESASLVRSFNGMVEALKEREARLQEANTSLKAINRNYVETLSFVTHELNTPVAAMMNYIYLLKQRLLGPLTDRQAKAAGVLDANIRRVAEMIRHYLNLSRIERNELKPVPVAVNVRAEVVQPLLEAAEPLVQAGRFVVENRIPGSLSVWADLNMTREVFENLISNAIKYGREGGLIRLDAQPREELVEFRVRNDGAGIPEDQRPLLFQKFSRLEGEGGGPRRPGTGLGLFICRHIVEAHGGRIEVQSAPGQWVEFIFTLPRPPAG